MKDYNSEELQEILFQIRDEHYREFQSKILTSVDNDTIIGVRAPDLRKIEQKYFSDHDKSQFLNNLPHKYYEENLLHVILISNTKDYAQCIVEINKFLPYINSWGVCDLFGPKIFKKHQDEVLQEIPKWLHSEHGYTVRFGLLMLMKYYFGENFDTKYLDWAAAVDSEHHYVRMMVAWYFATALAKHYDTAVKYIEEKKLPEWIHNKTIQKALESSGVKPEHKEYLRTLRVSE